MTIKQAVGCSDMHIVSIHSEVRGFVSVDYANNSKAQKQSCCPFIEALTTVLP